MDTHFLGYRGDGERTNPDSVSQILEYSLREWGIYIPILGYSWGEV